MSPARRNQAQRAADAFGELHGTAPHGVWSAPGRVNLIGEHTDYNDGFVLPFALPHRTAVAASPRADGVLSVSTLGDDGRFRHAAPVAVADLEPGGVSGWAAYPSGVAWALRAEGLTGGADLVIAGDVPSGAGLSSSHALECAVALALLGLAGVAEDRPRIARWVQRAENDFVGAPTGLLDQTASLLCTEAHVLFLDVRSGESEQVPFDTAAQDLEVLVIDTRASHSNTDGGYGARRAGCERAAALLGVRALRDVGIAELDEALGRLPDELRPLVRHVVTENERVLRAVDALRAGSPADLGPLLEASHASLRDDYRVSCPELDVAVASASAEGALGARMIGGGFGGSAIALVPVDRHEAVVRRVLAGYAERGWATPRTFPAVPSAGAGRDH
ncbi:galactokinase [Saccharothrix tamanrassetensis]|uniref:Galactokinase n=1 Tax=Saccharothrix tamanrassetensis TaxID=1051531 RepID=A0A841CXB3_9PSEU|nr:galactokinase [Saccharothrix tamanrassetensis]MBB5959996.1 galactokinase [Saccharothrix tamanrassetensis]